MPTTHVASANRHILQLFDSVQSRGAAVSAYLFEGWRSGNQLLVAVRSQHWKVIRAQLERRGCPVADAIATGHLTVLDAHATLQRFMRGVFPDPNRFEEIVGAHVSRQATSAQPLRIYGEMVDILAEEWNLEGAQRLEELWNGLACRYPFVLLCGYSSAHFADTSRIGALTAICKTHTEIQRKASDVMGSWLHQRSRRATKKAGAS